MGWTALWSSLKADSCLLPETTGGRCLGGFATLVCGKQQILQLCVYLAAVTDTDYIDATSVWLHSFTFLFELESKITSTVSVNLLFIQR